MHRSILTLSLLFLCFALTMPTTALAQEQEITAPVEAFEESTTVATQPEIVQAPEYATADEEPTSEDSIDLGDFGDFGDLDLAALLNADVSSASNKVLSLLDAPAIIEVISAKDIERWGASTILEVLSRVVGLEVNESYTGFANVSVRAPAREIWDARTLFLVDGFPIYEVGNGGAIHHLIPINAIDRIEILRGPGGVMFGTNALTGVINIITKDGKETAGSIRANGSYGAQTGFGAAFPFADQLGAEGQVNGTYGFEKGRISVNAQYARPASYIARNPETRDLGPNGEQIPYEFPRSSTTVNVSLRSVFQLGDHSIFLQGGFMNRQSQDWGLQPDFGVDPFDSRWNAGFAQLGYEVILPKVDISASIGYLQDTYLSDAGLYPSPTDPDFEFGGRTGADRGVFWDRDSSRVDGDLKVEAEINEKIFVSTGLNISTYLYRNYSLRFADNPDGSRGDLVPTMSPINYDFALVNSNLMSEVNWAVNDNLSLLAGMRVAYVYQGGQVVRPDLPKALDYVSPNPRLAAIIGAGDNAKIKVLYGSAFRVPFLYDVYAELLGVIEANVGLQPETMHTVELAYDARPLENLSVLANLFVNRGVDEIMNIARDPSRPTTIAHVNTQGSMFFGGEFLVKYVEKMIEFRVSGGYIQGWDQWSLSTGGVVQDMLARFQGRSELTFKLMDEKLFLTPMYKYITSRIGLPHVHLLDFTAQYYVNDNFKVGAELENATNNLFLGVERSEGSARSGIIRNRPLTATLWVQADF